MEFEFRGGFEIPGGSGSKDRGSSSPRAPRSLISGPGPVGGRAISALGGSSVPPSAKFIRAVRIPSIPGRVNFLAEETMPWTFLAEWPEGVLGAAVRHRRRSGNCGPGSGASCQASYPHGGGSWETTGTTLTPSRIK